MVVDKKTIFKFFLKLSNKIIVNSYEFKRDLKREFSVNSVCIYNPLNIKRDNSKSKKEVKKIFRNNKQLKILILEDLQIKDQITFLKGLNKLKNKSILVLL